MKKSLFIQIVVCFIFSLIKIPSYAQKEKFSEIEKKADSLKIVRLFSQATDERLKIYKQDSTYRDNIFEIALLYSLSGEKELAYDYLQRALHTHNDIKFLSYGDFYYIRNDARWNVLRDKQVEKYERINGKIKNKETAYVLWDTKMRDQAYYSYVDTENVDKEKIWAIKDSLNKINLKVLDSIVSHRGWPKKSEVGRSASVGAFLVIQHQELPVQKKYFPFIEKAVKQQEADKSDLALLTDRIRIFEGKKQIYGSQVITDAKGEFDYKTLVDPSNVNKRRKKMDLPPIEEYLQMFGLKWEYKK